MNQSKVLKDHDCLQPISWRKLTFLFNKVYPPPDNDGWGLNLSRGEHWLFIPIVELFAKKQKKRSQMTHPVWTLNVRSEHVLNPIAVGSQFESQILLHEENHHQHGLWINFHVIALRKYVEKIEEKVKRLNKIWREKFN